MPRSAERGPPRGLALRVVHQTDDAVEVQVKVRGELFKRHIFRWWRPNPTPTRAEMTDMIVRMFTEVNATIGRVQIREESRGPARE